MSSTFAALSLGLAVVPLALTGCGAGSSAATTPTSTPGAFDGPSLCKSRDLEECLGRALKLLTESFQDAYPGLVMQLAWKDAAKEITVVSGTVGDRPATVSDTFLFGSGTKPVTAVAVLKLVESGKISGDAKVSEIVNPYLQQFNGTTLEELFGADMQQAKVLDVIRMSAGIRDFEEQYDLDIRALSDGGYMDYPFEALRFTSTLEGNGTLCKPGECTAYSSSSYELAGLIVAAVTQSEEPWWKLDLGSVVDPQGRYGSLSFPPAGTKHGLISDTLTVPGYSHSTHWPSQEIFNQSSSILGWTCGNMVGTATDVARFYYDLFSDSLEAPVLTAETRATMLDFTPLTVGWKANQLNYSAGMQELDLSSNFSKESEQRPLSKDYFNYAYGHGGNTYSFASQQAYVPRANASFSVVGNTEHTAPKTAMACWVMDIAAEVYTGVPGNFDCGHIELEQSAVVV